MQILVAFHSYFRELAGCAGFTLEIPEGATIDELYRKIVNQFPKLAPLEKSTLIAVGVEYQPRDYVLHNGEEVSLFPPVQGG